MVANYVQDAFDAGEWSPYAKGRYSHPKYRSALAVCQNFLPIDTNALVRRPGTAHAYTTRRGGTGKLVSFSFENNEPFTLELTDSHIRSRTEADMNTDNANAVVSSISTASPAVVTLSAVPVGWANGDDVLFTLLDTSAQANVPYLANRIFTIGSVTSTTFTLLDAVTGANINGTAIGWTTQNVTVSRVVDAGTIYAAGDIPNVRFIQNEQAAIVLAPGKRPQELDVSLPPGASVAFNIGDADFVDGPYLDPINGVYIIPSALNGIITCTLSAPAYDSTRAYQSGDFATSSSVIYRSIVDQNLNNTPASSPTKWAITSPGEAIQPGGFQASDIGRHIRLLSEPPDWLAATSYSAGNVVKFNDAYWVALTSITGSSPSTGSIALTQPGVDATKWALTPSSARWTWGKITGLSTTGNLDPSTGTPFGNMTNGGGLHAAFDGVTNQTQAAGAYSLITDSSNGSGYVGLSFASGAVMRSIQVYPSTDKGFGGYGFSEAGGSYGTCRISMYASNTAPSSGSNGTLLGHVDISDSKTHTGAVTVISSDLTNTYKYVWVQIIDLFASQQYSRYMNVSELIVAGSTAAPSGSSVNVQILGDPLIYTTSVRVWRVGLYTDTNNVYPTCGCYSDGRLWLGGAVPNRFDASQANGFADGKLQFGPTEEDGTVADNDAISYTVNSSDLNQLLWMMPDQQGIICGTLGGEWLIDAPNLASGGFAPDNVRARRVTKYGCANIEPQRTGLTNVFVQRYQRKLMEYVADVFSGKLTAPNLSELARHIASPGIAEIRFQQEITPIVWNRGEDGSLFGCSYKRTSLLTSQPAELIGWHRHPLGTGRTVESICVGPSVDGLLEALSMITVDANGVRHVEIMRNIFDEEGNLMTAWQLDDAISPACGTSAGNTLILKGLHALDYTMVSVFIAGLDVGVYQVVDGQVTVPYGAANGLFTKRWMEQLQAQEMDFGDMATPIDGGDAIVPCIVGAAFNSDGQTMRPNAPEDVGTRLGPGFGKFKKVSRAAIQLHNTQDLQWGSDFDHLKPLDFRQADETPYTPTQLFSGIFWDTLDTDQNLDGQVAWRAGGVYPATILAVGPFIETNE